MSKGILPSEEYERMARELERMAAAIRSEPGIDNHFAERLEAMAAEMRTHMGRPPAKS